MSYIIQTDITVQKYHSLPYFPNTYCKLPRAHQKPFSFAVFDLRSHNSVFSEILVDEPFRVFMELREKTLQIAVLFFVQRLLPSYPLFWVLLRPSYLYQKSRFVMLLLVARTQSRNSGILGSSLFHNLSSKNNSIGIWRKASFLTITYIQDIAVRPCLLPRSKIFMQIGIPDLFHFAHSIKLVLDILLKSGVYNLRHYMLSYPIDVNVALLMLGYTWLL